MIRVDNALVIAAHPDDEVLGVGGTIPLIQRAGGSVTILIVTDGSSTQYRGDDEALRLKQQDARRAAEALGCESLVQWDFPDMRLESIPHVELNDAIAGLVREHSFDTVFVHHRGDINLDHQRIYASTLVAIRPTPDCPVRQVLCYEVNSSTEWGSFTPQLAFRPAVYVDIEETVEMKADALDVYGSELREYPHPRSREAVVNRARVRGNEVGFAYAEAFELVLLRGRLG
jgi:LmbE family N-acetylglucosaminyl deacetylase